MKSMVATFIALAVLVACSGGQIETREQQRGEKVFEPRADMPRTDVPDTFKWILTPLFADDAAFATALQEVGRNREELRRFAGKLGDPSSLRECLDLYFATRLQTNKLTLYANMRFDSDHTATDLQTMRDQSLDALHALMADSGFVRQEVLGLSDAAMAAAYRAEPTVETYRPYIDEQRRRRSRVLHPQAERVLSLAGDNLWAEIDLNEIPSDFEKTFGGVITGLDLPKLRDEEDRLVKLSLSNFPKYRSSSNRRVRQQAVERLFATLHQNRHALAATLSGQVRFNIFLARARGYDTALEAYLDKDNISPAVYHNLIDTVRANLKPLHDYVGLRKRVMELDEVHIYDLYPSLVADVEMTFPYDEAQKVLPAALAPLGPEYLEVLNKGIDPKEGWLDLYPNENKDSGAFSASVYKVHPYVKMNYYNSSNDLSTLAHEYGHALHSYFSMATQPYVTFNYSTFVAEIASTTNEKLLSDYLLTRAESDAEKLYILNNLLERIRTTIYRQALFAEFELRIHTAAEQGTPLTAEFLSKTYAELIADYYGPNFTMDEHDSIEWAYIPHFYYKYYVFSYATGLSSGIALAEGVQSGDVEKRDAYLGMLRAGSSKPPLDILRDAGVDLTKPDAIESAARLMQKLINEIDELAVKGKAPRQKK
ncbi:MAG: oligoendopeptidase F [Deltaproteobacteria bacterium RIFOXYA12_FULL_58_15]|nr:MAG: oligoendopeptidase F [Deltaproteobacteria bacterium RIFOXYA12_FULL_58_15]OGR08996.1 MAG: oligoendopeptidase F [Deltaproteobacteria bacterium RIFOXYB12_FULL_58_9]